MSMNEKILLLLLLGNFSAILFGIWSTNNLWKAKAKGFTRKECRGRLYWVVEDGDINKLKQVQKCFDSQ